MWRILIIQGEKHLRKDLEQNILKLLEVYKRMMLFVARKTLYWARSKNRLMEDFYFARSLHNYRIYCFRIMRVYFVFIEECCCSAKLPPSSFVTEIAIWGERHSMSHSPPIRWICRSPQIQLAVASQRDSRHLDDPKGCDRGLLLCSLLPLRRKLLCRPSE